MRQTSSWPADSVTWHDLGPSHAVDVSLDANALLALRPGNVLVSRVLHQSAATPLPRNHTRNDILPRGILRGG